MSAISIASRYAKSIIELAQEQDVLDAVIGDMQSFEEALKNRDLVLLINSPIIKSDKKQQIFKELFGASFHKLTNGFFEITIRKRRESFLPEITRQFILQYKKLKHITTATLTTAVPISEKTVDAVKEKVFAGGHIEGTLEVNTQVVPAIMGGFILELEGRIYDASVHEKLALLKQEILDNSYIKSL